MSIRSAFGLLRSLPLIPPGALARGKTPRCPACAARSPRLFDGTRTPGILICRDCRHCFWERMPSLEELDHFYREKYGESHNQPEIQRTHRSYYRSHVELLVNLSGKPKPEICLIDYGSSIPVLIEEAKDSGVGRPIAVDLDRLAFEYAREHGLEILTPAEYGDQIEEGSVDILRFSHVLEHMPDPRKSVEQAARKLRTGGVLYITQPGFPVFRPRRTDYRLKDSVFPSHLHFFSPISLVKLTSGFGLQVEKLFTDTRCDEVYDEVAQHLDLDYARKCLQPLSGKGEEVRGERANYPFFTGENSEIYLRKTG
jgi:SAM-dependent methyltransferase